MITKIVFLIKSLKIPYRNILLKCVNPLLMGAVLSIIFIEPLNIQAATVNADQLYFAVDGVTSTVSSANTYSGVFYPIIKSVDMVETPNQVNKYGSDKNVTTVSYELDIPITVFLDMLEMPSGIYNFRYILNFDKPVISVDNSSFISLKYVSTPLVSVVSDYGKSNFQLTNGRYWYWKWLYSEYLYNTFDGYKVYLDNIKIHIEFNAQFWSGTTNFEPDLVHTKVTINNIGFYTPQSGLYDYLGSSSTEGLLQEQIDQDFNFREQDQSDAEQAGSDMTGFADQLNGLQGAWRILWYPIDFTNRFVQVFTGGTAAAAYQDEYMYTVGYRYNDENGFLEPIQARSAQPRSAGTGITFPAFEFMGFKIWDSYTYDLSQVIEQVPVVFDAIYVIVSILEMMWFVGFLRSKYDEVFG